MKLSVHLPDQIVAVCILLPLFSKNGLKLENCQYISSDNNINNLNQPINLPWKLRLELANGNMNTVFSIREKKKLFFFHDIKQRVTRIKSQIYKNTKIIF